MLLMMPIQRIIHTNEQRTLQNDFGCACDPPSYCLLLLFRMCKYRVFNTVQIRYSYQSGGGAGNICICSTLVHKPADELHTQSFRLYFSRMLCRVCVTGC